MTTTPPDLDAVKAYLELEDDLVSDETLQSALAAETKAQAAVCTIPVVPVDPDDEDAGDVYAADIAEALFRRVAHNLALRGLPLGVQASLADGYVATNRVGGTDAEVRRLEAPYRKLPVG